MSDGINVLGDGDTLVICVTVGDKTMRVRVTPDYARQLAAKLLVLSTPMELERGRDGRYVDA